MARKPKRRPRPQAVEYIDATPERLAKGDHSEFINPAKIDSSEQPIGNVRRFKSSHLDRLYLAEKISWSQWFAGDWYRTTAEKASCSPSSVSSYGQGCGGSTPFYAFLPRNIRQLQDRDMIHEARKQWPADMHGFMDRFLVRNDLPRYSRRTQARRISQIAKALDAMAHWLRVGS